MRRVFNLLVSLILVLAVAWVALWWYAQGRLEAGLRTALDQEQSNGVVLVSYDSLTRGTSPLAATVTLVNPRWTFQGPRLPVPFSFSLPSVTLRIAAADPLTLHIDLAPKLTLSTPRGTLTVAFGDVAMAEQLDPQALFNPQAVPFKGQFSALADNVAVSAAGDIPVFTIDKISEQGHFDASAGAGGKLYDSALDIRNLTLSPLLAKLGNVPFNGQVADFGLTLALTGPLPADWRTREDAMRAAAPGPNRIKLAVQFVHDWAAAGGTAQAGASFTLGTSTLTTSGGVAFDANVQPQGSADVLATHLDDFTAAVTSAYPQTASGLAKVQAQLTPYLSASNTDGQVLKLHLDYGKAGVVLNGQKLEDEKPLDWNALENPPPPPVQAPGDGSGAASP